MACGTNDDRQGDTADNSADSHTDSNTSSGPPLVACEVASEFELASVDEVAPNGRSAAELLDAIPDSFQTTLHWDESSSSVEVEIEGVSGQSSTFDLTFTLPANPTYWYEERVVVDEMNQDVAVICDDYVKTKLDIHAETQDGALDFDLNGVEVKLGSSDPNVQSWATPFILTSAALSSPEVDFIAPVSQAADSNKDIAFSFDGPGVSGAITVYASDSSDTHRLILARW